MSAQAVEVQRWGYQYAISAHMADDPAALTFAIRQALRVWRETLADAGGSPVSLPSVSVEPFWDDVDDEGAYFMRPRTDRPTGYAVRVAGKAVVR